MPARLLALLLALVVTAGAASRAMAAPSDMADVAGLVDDGVPELAPAIVMSSVALDVPARCELGCVVAPLEQPGGRLYRAWVFRPPR